MGPPPLKAGNELARLIGCIDLESVKPKKYGQFFAIIFVRIGNVDQPVAVEK